jgi:hypothetical protein
MAQHSQQAKFLYSGLKTGAHTSARVTRTLDIILISFVRIWRLDQVRHESQGLALVLLKLDTKENIPDLAVN